MFNLEMIKNELNRLSASVGDEFDIPVSINGRLTRTLGRVVQCKNGCDWYPERMEFSRQLLETATEQSIKGIIAHEWAHYYATKMTGEDHGHDDYFKSICARIGCTEDKVSTKVNRIVSNEQIYKYSVYCPTCGEPIAHYSRMCSTLKHLDECTCKRCGGGNLYYKQNH